MKYYSLVDLPDADYNPIVKQLWEVFEKNYGELPDNAELSVRVYYPDPEESWKLRSHPKLSTNLKHF